MQRIIAVIEVDEEFQIDDRWTGRRVLLAGLEESTAIDSIETGRIRSPK